MKKLISIFLAVCIMSLISPCGTSASIDVMFSNEKTKEYVQQLTQLGLFDLYSEGGAFFDETTAVKRGEAAKALVDLFGYGDELSGNETDTFYDVPNYYEYADEIYIAVKKRLMVGVGGGLFEPDSNIITKHFMQVLVTALGYDWKAALPTYTDGYMSVARELGLLDGIYLDSNEELSRENMVYIIYNSLDVPITIAKGVSGEYITYDIDENITLLSHYHNIYTDEGVVLSDDMISLDSRFTPDEYSVIIGEDRLSIDTETDIFKYLGCEVEYFYLQDANYDKKKLLIYNLLDSDDVVTIYSGERTKADISHIEAEKENGRSKTYKIASGADVYYNGRQINTNLDTYIKSFNGYAKLINIDRDKSYDFVIMTNYIYDEIVGVDTEKRKIYCKSQSFDVPESDSIRLRDKNENPCELEEFASGDVIAVADSLNQEYRTIVHLNDRIAISVATIDEDGISDFEGTMYYFSKGLPQNAKALLKVGITLYAIVDARGEVVWFSKDAATSSDLQLGYLIKVSKPREDDFGMYETSATILTLDGSVVKYVCADKVKIDNTSVKTENVKAVLSNIKSSLLLPSDGDVSQMVKYRINDKGLLREIKTASAEGGLIKKFSCTDLSIQNHGYDTGAIGELYPITKNVPLFRVPKTNQEDYEEKYFTVVNYNVDSGPKSGDTVTVEGYVDEEEKVLADGIVMYETAITGISPSAKLFLVEKVMQVYDDNESAVRGKISGYWSSGNYAEVMLEPTLAIPTALSKGDACVFNIDMTGVASAVELVYDYETDTVQAPYSTTTRERDIKIVHVYNAPVGSDFVEAYTDTTGFASKAPDSSKLVTLNFVAVRDAWCATFNRTTEEISKGRPKLMVDYKHDTIDYAKVLVRYQYGFPNDYIIYQ